jgi:hypothetical protein
MAFLLFSSLLNKPLVFLGRKKGREGGREGGRGWQSDPSGRALPNPSTPPPHTHTKIK